MCAATCSFGLPGELEASGNTDIVRACLATSKYISGLAATALSYDYESANAVFAETQERFASEAEFFVLVQGPYAEMVLSNPVYAIQGFMDKALECTKLSVTKCSPGDIAERAVFATHALEQACAEDFKKGH